MLILGLETSCDETAAAVVEDGVAVHANVVATQHDLHERYAGVVPEIASRAHLERLLPVVHDALKRAGVRVHDLDAVAVGNRPGLVGSLIVGVSAAKALAWSLDKPLIGVDHVRAHLHAAFLEDTPRGGASVARGAPADAAAAAFSDHGSRTTDHVPALGLVVSGGHTSLYRMRSDGGAVRLGRTIDDAVGEAYDKAGVLLNAGYPGGPNIDKLAQTGDPDGPDIPKLPVSMLGTDSLDFSFSGLKTALLYAVRGHPEGRGKSATFPRTVDDLTDARRADLAAAFQYAAVEAVIRKLRRALRQDESVTSLIVGGGVSANSELRRRLACFAERHGLSLHLPALRYCVDNAAMIAGYAAVTLAADGPDDLTLPVVATSKA